jgi:hypothetical protein
LSGPPGRVNRRIQADNPNLTIAMTFNILLR